MSTAPAGGRRRGARAAVAAPALAAVSAWLLAPAGCGVGEGESSGGEATLTVSRDYGAESLREARVEPSTSETVLRLLDGEAEITTRYGGGFVQSIDGLEGGSEDGRRLDWFFYVNGLESSVGAAEVDVSAGDRIWWDFHDWTDVMRVPAVIGSWPAPFSTSDPAEVRCRARAGACEAVSGLIEEVASGEAEQEAPTVLVGPWARLRGEDVARNLERGPEASGVFGRFETSRGGWELVALDATLDERERLGAGAGLVAALREGEEPPTWLVTGTDDAGVAAAAELLGDEVEGRFALAAPPEGDPLPLPVP